MRYNWSTSDICKMIHDRQEYYRKIAKEAEAVENFELTSIYYDRIIELSQIGEDFCNADDTLHWTDRIKLKEMIWGK